MSNYRYYFINVGDQSLINYWTGLHEVPSELRFEGKAREVLLPSQVHFATCLVKRGFISKVNS